MEIKVPKFICDRIVDQTCTQTTNCCPHRLPHVLEENYTCTKQSHECRFAPGNEALCVPYRGVSAIVPLAVPVLKETPIAPVPEPAPVPAQRPVEYIEPKAEPLPEPVPEPTPEPETPAPVETKTDRRYRGAKRLPE